jgi:septal ring factor EnvC (AmiA/AmiB activator)
MDTMERTVRRGVARGASGSVGVGILIVLALGLCGLCAVQWARETRLRLRVDELQGERQKLNDEKVAVEAQGKRFQDDIQRIERERSDLMKSAETNNAQLVRFRADLQRANFSLEQTNKVLSIYVEGLQKANDAIRQQNEGVTRLKSDYSKLVEDRNQIVGKFNDLAKQHESTVKQFNELIEKWNNQQEQLKAESEKQAKQDKK